MIKTYEMLECRVAGEKDDFVLYSFVFHNCLSDSVGFLRRFTAKFSRLMSLLFRTVERLGDNINELKEQNITCLNRMVGLLMSLSYENGMLIAVMFFLLN